ncbi:serine threonine kinase [Fusarium sporotrichioides]|uniref:Serine threonine kinase n=1 Tax=Fusarium sporotrichioides TaxID=5514 RepID=A0A395SWA1_FUSSP|nr:serine threonine kinase [Fusarium sporotrichioides]
MVKSVMSQDRLQQVYDSLMASSAIPAHNSLSSAQDFTEMVEEKKLRHFLAVLMYAECSIKAAKVFVERLVIETEEEETQQWSKATPYLLPARKEYLENLFSDPKDVYRFLHRQRPFCTLVVGGPDMITISSEDPRNLPWLSEEELSSGSFGVLYKVRVAEGHLTRSRDLKQTNNTPDVIARKDFKFEAEASFEKEWEAVTSILNSTQQHNNIVKCFGAIVTEGPSSKFSLLMPLADMDLDEYMQRYPEAIINDRGARQRLIKAAMGLAAGLAFLHGGLKTKDGGENLICYHMDLKPTNVLVFDVNSDMTWKLSDFGLSRVKQKRQPVFDISKIFQRRVRDQSSKATATVNLRGDGTYLPREAQDEGKTMDEKSDVWSLGCIVSLLFTFMEEGLQGIEPFSDSRHKYSNNGCDVFYQHNKTTSTYSINKGVKKQHEKLIEAAKERNATEGEILSFILKWLETDVLAIKQDRRRGAATINQRLLKTLEKYKDLGNTPLPQPSTKSPSLFKIVKQKTESTFSGLRDSSGFYRSRRSIQTDVSQWRLGIEKSTRFKGSNSSPDGKFLVYWNDQVMKLFSYSAVALSSVSSFQSGNTSTFSERSRSKEQVLRSTGQHVLQSTRQSWRCGALTNRYLIAAPTDGTDTFKCYIFDIHSDATLETYSQITLADIGCGIHKLIAPPDQHSFACILNDKAKRCSILITAINPNPSPQPNDQPVSSRKSLQSNRTDAGICLPQPRICSLRWPAIQIEHAVFQTTNEMYIVVRRPSDLSLHSFNVDSAEALQKDLNLKATEDNSGRLFTDMICFSNADDSSKTDVIVVAQRESIFHFTFNGADKNPNAVRHLPIKHYWILKIARNEAGSIVALGTHSGSSNVLLLSIKLKGKGIRPEPKELAELDGLLTTHQPKLSLLRGGNGTIAQITAATPEGQYRVYRLDLSGVLDT